MYKHDVKEDGQYLAKKQAVPQNDTAVGNGMFVENCGGTMGGIEIVAVVDTEVGLADTKVLSVRLQDSADGTTYADLETIATVTADSASFTLAAGTQLGGRIVRNADRDYIRVSITTDDAAATGTISVYPRYLPR